MAFCDLLHKFLEICILLDSWFQFYQRAIYPTALFALGFQAWVDTNCLPLIIYTHSPLSKVLVFYLFLGFEIK